MFLAAQLFRRIIWKDSQLPLLYTHIALKSELSQSGLKWSRSDFIIPETNSFICQHNLHVPLKNIKKNSSLEISTRLGPIQDPRILCLPWLYWYNYSSTQHMDKGGPNLMFRTSNSCTKSPAVRVVGGDELKFFCSHRLCNLNLVWSSLTVII
jgi:hypothetical protein